MLLMNSLTPAERAAALARVAAIEEATRAPSTSDNLTDVFRLFLELNALLHSLGEISASESERWDNELRQAIGEIESAERRLAERNQEPTPSQQVMPDFAARLAARQGTVTPDFDALHKAKAAVDQKYFGR